MNAHGVFGFINAKRFELVLSYTHAEDRAAVEASVSGRRGQAAGDAASAVAWAPLDFKCLPGTLDRRPCLVTPYHYRLDWETWIYTTASPVPPAKLSQEPLTLGFAPRGALILLVRMNHFSCQAGAPARGPARLRPAVRAGGRR